MLLLTLGTLFGVAILTCGLWLGYGLITPTAKTAKTLTLPRIDYVCVYNVGKNETTKSIYTITNASYTIK